ncbi:MAG: hypothetical protein U0P45_06325 [Acidimicrobiales bacterium]
MTRPSLPYDLPADHLRVTPWHDPVLDAVGHDPRSPYVERFLLPILGPSTTLLVRRLATELEAQPEGLDLDLDATARSLGLSLRGGPTGPFYRALARTQQFHITAPTGPTAFKVRLRLQTLTHRQVDRLPEALRREHAAWTTAPSAEPDDEQRRRRARLLALSLLELGEPLEAAQLQLHRWKVHPAVATDALRWAQARIAGKPPVVAAAASGTPNPQAGPTAGAAPRPRPIASFDPGDAA